MTNMAWDEIARCVYVCVRESCGHPRKLSQPGRTMTVIAMHGLASNHGRPEEFGRLAYGLVPSNSEWMQDHERAWQWLEAEFGPYWPPREAQGSKDT